MGLSDKRILLIISDYTLKTKVVETVKPLVKILLEAKNDDEAFKKAANQDFDCIILRTPLPMIGDPKRFFEQSKKLKTVKDAHWIVLGRDIENELNLVANKHLKFIGDPSDGAELIKILEGLMYSPSEGQMGILDVTYVNPFISAVVSVIEQMGKVSLERGTPSIRAKGVKAEAAGDVTGLVPMNSERFVGSMAISFEQPAILKIYENMVKTKPNEINDDVKDAVAELTNIIFGDAKRNWNSSGHTIEAALPSVVSGPKHEIPHSVEAKGIIIPFQTPDGKIVIECVMKPKPASN